MGHDDQRRYTIFAARLFREGLEAGAAAVGRRKAPARRHRPIE
jgi:hypothetical protein